LLIRIVHRVWPGLVFQAIWAVEHTAELAMVEFGFLFSTNPASERVSINLPLWNRLTQREDWIIFIESHMDLFSDHYVIDFLRDSLIFGLKLSSVRV
jgi:hypothetical protein